MIPFGVRSLNIRCRIKIGIQEGTIILTTTHIGVQAHSAFQVGHRASQDEVRMGLGFGVWGLGFRV